MSAVHIGCNMHSKEQNRIYVNTYKVVFLLSTPGMVPDIIQDNATYSKITTTLIVGEGREGGSHGIGGCAD